MRAANGSWSWIAISRIDLKRFRGSTAPRRRSSTSCSRGELARAAVVATDIRATLASFDPVVFFPSMFAAYFKTLHQVIEELAPFFADTDNPAWHALDSYYRADMSAFFDD